MWKIDKPTVSARDSFTKSISRMHNGPLKVRLEAIEGLITSNSNSYEDSAQANTLHNFPRVENVASVTAAEMATVYDQRFAAKKSPARDIYDQLLSAPTNACCPLCGHREATTIDHHLPKMEYPVLAVSPQNLVPACMECNKLKGEYFPIASEEQLLHPYFDEIDIQRWLKAKVKETNPTSIIFYVEKPDSWSDLLFKRIQNHFDKFKLNELYATQAATELSGIRKRAQDLFNLGGPAQVKNHFLQESESRRAAALNSWRTAAYEAIYQSSWYCSGNF
jgi:hypothetical protein